MYGEVVLSRGVILTALCVLGATAALKIYLRHFFPSVLMINSRPGLRYGESEMREDHQERKRPKVLHPCLSQGRYRGNSQNADSHQKRMLG